MLIAGWWATATVRKLNQTSSLVADNCTMNPRSFPDGEVYSKLRLDEDLPQLIQGIVTPSSHGRSRNEASILQRGSEVEMYIIKPRRVDEIIKVQNDVLLIQALLIL
jgi:hypothetical protein